MLKSIIISLICASLLSHGQAMDDEGHTEMPGNLRGQRVNTYSHPLLDVFPRDIDLRLDMRSRSRLHQVSKEMLFLLTADPIHTKNWRLLYLKRVSPVDGIPWMNRLKGVTLFNDYLISEFFIGNQNWELLDLAISYGDPDACETKVDALLDGSYRSCIRKGDINKNSWETIDFMTACGITDAYKAKAEILRDGSYPTQKQKDQGLIQKTDFSNFLSKRLEFMIEENNRSDSYRIFKIQSYILLIICLDEIGISEFEDYLFSLELGLSWLESYEAKKSYRRKENIDSSDKNRDKRVKFIVDKAICFEDEYAHYKKNKSNLDIFLQEAINDRFDNDELFTIGCKTFSTFNFYKSNIYKSVIKRNKILALKKINIFTNPYSSLMEYKNLRSIGALHYNDGGLYAAFEDMLKKGNIPAIRGLLTFKPELSQIVTEGKFTRFYSLCPSDKEVETLKIIFHILKEYSDDFNYKID